MGLGLLSTSFAGFAQDAYGGVTSWRGGYGTALGAAHPLPVYHGCQMVTSAIDPLAHLTARYFHDQGTLGIWASPVDRGQAERRVTDARGPQTPEWQPRP